MTRLRSNLSNFWNSVQQSLFPFLENVLEVPFSAKLQQLILILDMIRIESFVENVSGFIGRPPKKRYAIARSFIAKAVFNISDTKLLIDRLRSDRNLRRVCGFESIYEIPSESTFCRAFKEFSLLEMPQKAHEALIKYAYKDEIIGHISKDSTAIEAREKPIRKPKKVKKIETKKRAPKGCRKLTRIEIQASGSTTLDGMIFDLPKFCDIGRKTNSNGHFYTWIGFKLHLAVDDHGVPLAAILSSASMNDSQAAIPLAEKANKRVKNFYDLMDSGYYANAIIEHSKSLGHVPIIEVAPKGEQQKNKKELEKLACKNLRWNTAETIRYKHRTAVERANSRLKDEFGALNIRVKGYIKVFSHLMFGLLSQTADQLLKLAT